MDKKLTRNIPDRIMDDVIRNTGGSGNYASIVKEGGFRVGGNEAPVKEFIGKILEHQVYQAKWVDGKMDRLAYNGGDVEAGYGLRGEIAIQCSQDDEFMLSLPKTSLIACISYIQQLKTKGMRPEQVVTRITTNTVNGYNGLYSVCVFEQLPEPFTSGESFPGMPDVNVQVRSN